jgi:hypothetical protein
VHGLRAYCILFTGDLEGLKVGHDFDALDEGDARILTLKDSRILDNEGEQLYVRYQYILIHLIRGRTAEC